MKKVFLTLAIAGALVACKNGNHDADKAKDSARMADSAKHVEDSTKMAQEEQAKKDQAAADSARMAQEEQAKKDSADAAAKGGKKK